MNAAQAHLLVNHVPVLIPFVGAGVVVAGLILKSSTIRQVGLCLILLGALGAIPAYLTGQSAESYVKNYPGVSRFLMHHHEQAATQALIAIEIAGALSLVLLILAGRVKTIRPTIWGTLLVLTVVAFVLVARAAHLGGMVRHEEIRPSDMTFGID